MKTLQWRTKNPEETKAVAKLAASLAKPGDILTLEGDLGAGKTTFTKGFAEGLGITSGKQPDFYNYKRIP